MTLGSTGDEGKALLPKNLHPLEEDSEVGLRTRKTKPLSVVQQNFKYNVIYQDSMPKI